MRHMYIASLVVALSCGGCWARSSLEDGGPSDTDADTDTGTSYDPQCFDKDDFTLCEVVTDPDLSYDICVWGWCHSPGRTGNTPGPHFPLADTNQRRCFDDYGVFGVSDGGVPDGGSTCPSEGEPFFGQDAQYGWDTVHEATERFTRDTVTTPSEPVVVDNVTGLMWQGCVTGLSGDACATGTPAEYKWSEALDHCDALSFGGHDTWRLPDIYEMHSVLDFTMSDSPIDSSAFPGMPEGKLWTSGKHHVEDIMFRSYADLESGHFGSGATDNAALNVLCVRRGPMGTRRLEPSIVSGDRVVVDTATGLEWQGCAAGLAGEQCDSGAEGTMTWREALSFCEGLSWAGSDDWRLPNANELLSIVGTPYYYGEEGFNDDVFPNMPPKSLWSSTSDRSDPTLAYVMIHHAFVMGGMAKTKYRIALCVRE